MEIYNTRNSLNFLNIQLSGDFSCGLIIDSRVLIVNTISGYNPLHLFPFSVSSIK